MTLQSRMFRPLARSRATLSSNSSSTSNRMTPGMAVKAAISKSSRRARMGTALTTRVLKKWATVKECLAATSSSTSNSAAQETKVDHLVVTAECALNTILVTATAHQSRYTTLQAAEATSTFLAAETNLNLNLVRTEGSAHHTKWVHLTKSNKVTWTETPLRQET